MLREGLLLVCLLQVVILLIVTTKSPCASELQVCNGGRCIDEWQGFHCEDCPSGRWGDDCSRQCDAPTCVGKYSCDQKRGDHLVCFACAPGYSGDACQIAARCKAPKLNPFVTIFDGCHEQAKIGGICKVECQEGYLATGGVEQGECEGLENGEAKFTEISLECVAMDDCKEETKGPGGHGCANGGQCVDSVKGDGKFTCDCRGTGFGGKNCEEQGRVVFQKIEVTDAKLDDPQVIAARNLVHGPFALASPHFVCDEDNGWWQGYSPMNNMRDRMGQISEDEKRTHPIYKQLDRKDRQMVIFNTPRYERGQVVVLRDFAFAMPHDCGQNARWQDLQNNARGRAGDPLDRSFFIFIPATWAFQHWIDSTMPKIAQASLAGLPLKPNTTIFQELIEDRFPIVNSLWGAMGIPRNKIIDNLGAVVNAKESLYTCNTPPHHPVLWQEGVRLLGVGKYDIPVEQRSKVVVMSRSIGGVASNGGRINRNEPDMLVAVEKFLRAHKELDHLQISIFNHTALHEDVELYLRYFADARVIIGQHGGALTNLVFAGAGTQIIELWVHRGGQATVGHEALAYWYQSTMLDMDYWLIRAEAVENDDFNTDVPKVIQALEKGLL